MKKISLLLVLSLLLTACSTADIPDAVEDTEAKVPQSSLLPLGDQKYTTSAKVGYIYLCNTNMNGGGAFADGPWITGNTWDPTKKITVDGSVTWKNASFAIAEKNGKRVITANNLPSHITGTFPVAKTDDAYSYDRNPNSIKTQTVQLELPLNPTVATTPTCMAGEVGFMTSGVSLFNGFDAGGRDAVAHEIQDNCDGHPQISGQYHYHGASRCITDTAGKLKKHSALVGYALDGFGIYGEYGDKGKELRTANLDECHGHTGKVTWNGKEQSVYHYHLTDDFPYSVSCFKGTPVQKQIIPGTMGENGGGQGMPPPRR